MRPWVASFHRRVGKGNWPTQSLQGGFCFGPCWPQSYCYLRRRPTTWVSSDPNCPRLFVSHNSESRGPQLGRQCIYSQAFPARNICFAALRFVNSRNFCIEDSSPGYLFSSTFKLLGRINRIQPITNPFSAKRASCYLVIMDFPRGSITV